MISQVFDEGISSLARAKTVTIMLLPKHADKIQCHNLSPMKTTVIGHFLFRLNTIALFSGQIFKIDNTPVNASLIF